MAVCFFDNKYDKSFECEYSINDNVIEVIVKYDISTEFKMNENGFRTFGENTEIKDRDILIVDSQTKNNYLLKNAYFSDYKLSFTIVDNTPTIKFNSKYYLFHKNYEKLIELPKILKIEKIKLYNNLINKFIGYPSYSKNEENNELVIKLKKDYAKQYIKINRINISQIVVSDGWNCICNNSNEISIKLTGYLELILIDKINCDDVFDYIYELIIYLQLLRPNKLIIEKVKVFINGTYYELCCPKMNELKYSDKYICNSVSDEFSNFIKKCYEKIPYRNSENEIRNIPYIILKTSRSLEDNFLMFYRFIECYYKNKNRFFLLEGLKGLSEYKGKDKSNDIEDLICEIKNLRNHYTHSGYFIKNKEIKIVNKYGSKKYQNVEYITVDYDWIYKRTMILYKVVINIIFTEMLEYKKYKFDIHF